MNRKKIVVLIVLTLLGAGGWYITTVQSKTDEQSKKPTSNIQSPKVVEEPTKFNKTQHSIDEADSIWVVVNKLRPLSPSTYRPDDLTVPDVRLRVPGHQTMQLRTEAATALEAMFDGARNDGIELMLSSAFRSFEYQRELYGGYVKSQGQAVADTQSARPGYSEHQTGLAADIRPVNGECELEQCFGEMEEGKWIAANAHRYGFIIRYTQTNQSEAGYSYEPWHVRYVGKELAGELKDKNVESLESFFDLAPAADYATR